MAIALDHDASLDLSAEREPPRPGLPFAFTGRAGEYFGIWIVNLLLSIVTLGIYSAWAKVRTKRYFYGNTKLSGSAFDYVASPIQILKGRLIVFAFLAAYAIITSFWPLTIWPFIAVMFLLTPWAVVRARAFNAHYSTFRNVRFGFSAGMREAFVVYAFWPFVALLTLGAALPYSAYRADRFLVDNARYGRTDMTFDGGVRAYYRIYGVALIIGLPAVILIGAFWAFSIYVSIQTIGLEPSETERLMEELGGRIVAFFAMYGDWLPYLLGSAVLLGVTASSYLTASRQNYLFDNTRLGFHQLRLDLSFSRILWIRLSNLVAIALSFGLMIPWARIRMARYQIERMSLMVRGDLDTLASDARERSGAYGDELGEGMDLDLGLGV